ncbi:MAG: glycosyltransferase family 2 protein [Candidatus Omnitrophica bacterium]|nr:glycosyltransferase family 2 protein [Candidatus Omnitrophota bacterium]
MKISVAIITLNEERNIADCLETVRWADEIVLVDSGSTDRTLEIASQFTHHVYEESFKNFASQKNAALKRVRGEWIFFIDADERISAALAERLRQIAVDSKLDTVYAVKRLTYFFGHQLKHSGCQDDYPIRFFPAKAAHFEQPVHEEIVTKLPVRKLEEPLIHYSTKDRQHYQQKLDLYIPLEHQTMKLRRRSVNFLEVLIRPVLKFIFLYFIKLGIFDGVPGFQYAALSSYYDFLKFNGYRKMENAHAQTN